MDRDGRRNIINRVQRGWLDGTFVLVLLGACLVQFVLVEVHRGTSWQLWTALSSNLWREKTHEEVVRDRWRPEQRRPSSSGSDRVAYSRAAP